VEHFRLVPHMQRKNILHLTDTIGFASFLADFYVLYIDMHGWNTWNMLECCLRYLELIPAMQRRCKRTNTYKSAKNKDTLTV
jgi:hypothetical protein